MGEGMGRRAWRFLLAIMVAAMISGGCADWFSSTADTGTSSQLQPPPGQAGAKYYDFPDIPIPGELTMVPDESQVFQGGDIKNGMLTFRGRVDPGSLIAFFQAAMHRENWTLLGSARHRKSVLVFHKPDKNAVFLIYEEYLYTYVEVYVVATPPGN